MLAEVKQDPLPPVTDPICERLRAFLRGGVYLLVLLTPLPFASVQDWAVLAIQLVGSVLAAMALLVVWREGSIAKPVVLLAALPALLLVCWGTVQCLPLPDSWGAVLIHRFSEIRGSVLAHVGQLKPMGLSPLSISPPDTADAALRVGAYLLIGVAAFVGFAGGTRIGALVKVIVLAGAFQGLYGSAEYLSGHQHIFAYQKVHYLDSATGTFINRNHYASFLAMCIPFVIALYHSSSKSHYGTSSRRGFSYTALASTIGHPAAIPAGFLLLTGLILSYSRAGLVVGVFAILLALWLMRMAHRRSLLWIAASCFALLYVSMLQVEPAGARFAASSQELTTLHSRIIVWKASVPAVRDFGWTGSGLGTFAELFPSYKPAGLLATWTHAHNHWLELVLAAGLFVAGGVCIAVVVLLVASRHYLRNAPIHGPGAAVVVMISIVSLHSVVDFALAMPAIAVVLSVGVGSLVGGVRD